MLRPFAIFLGSLSLLAATPSLAGPNGTLTFTSTGPSIGNIADGMAGSGTTTFTISSAGSVSQAGGGSVRVTSGTASNSLLFTCTVKICSTFVVQIAATGSPTGRMGPVTNFTATAGSPAPTSFSTTGSGTSNLTITLSVPVGQAAVNIGMEVPVLDNSSASSSGNASSSFAVTSVTTGFTGGTGSATAVIQRPIGLVKASDLVFGKLVKPSSSAGNGTATIDSATGLRGVTGTIAVDASSSSSRAAYTVSGEGATTFSISVPTSVNLTSGGNTLVATLTPSATGSQTLLGSLGSGGTFSLGVGGSIPVTNTTPSGSYVGSFVVTATYN
jgi:hypothetical protein